MGFLKEDGQGFEGGGSVSHQLPGFAKTERQVCFAWQYGRMAGHNMSLFLWGQLIQ